MACIWGI